MSQPPDQSTPRWSPDRLWWWDGDKWVPATQATPVGYGPPPPPAPGYLAQPPSAGYWVPPPPVAIPPPSPGLRIFLLVVLIVTALITGLFSLAGVAATTQASTDIGSPAFLFAFLV